VRIHILPPLPEGEGRQYWHNNRAPMLLEERESARRKIC
jgi:hypothetical protein